MADVGHGEQYSAELMARVRSLRVFRLLNRVSERQKYLSILVAIVLAIICAFPAKTSSFVWSIGSGLVALIKGASEDKSPVPHYSQYNFCFWVHECKPSNEHVPEVVRQADNQKYPEAFPKGDRLVQIEPQNVTTVQQTIPSRQIETIEEPAVATAVTPAKQQKKQVAENKPLRKPKDWAARNNNDPLFLRKFRAISSQESALSFASIAPLVGSCMLYMYLPCYQPPKFGRESLVRVPEDVWKHLVHGLY